MIIGFSRRYGVCSLIVTWRSQCLLLACGSDVGYIWRMDEALVELPAIQQRSMLTNKEVSAVELLEAHLARVEAVNPVVNAIVGIDESVALRRAQAVDAALVAGDAVGPLAGLVTAHKDLTSTKDFPTTFGLSFLAGKKAASDSLLVERMQAAGAVAIGKTNVPELGAGSHTFNSVYGTTVNPFDVDRSAGGSSGGAAVGLRTGMLALADGSDAGGSLRNPAAWNNVVGFRTSPRLVPNVSPGNPWNTMGIDGPMARNVDDLHLLLSVIGQPDTRDPLSRSVDYPSTLTPPDRPLRVAFSPTLGGLPVESDVASTLASFVAQVESELDWSIEYAEPDLSGADEAFIALRAFLFATRPETAGLLPHMDEIKATVQGEIERGLALSSQDVADGYARASAAWRNAANFFTTYDLLIAPVTQVSPFPIDQEYPTEVDGQPMEHYIEWMKSNYLITVAGTPALSLPAGFTQSGLPVGAQIIGPHYQEIAVLRAAKAMESATGHGQRWPTLAPQ